VKALEKAVSGLMGAEVAACRHPGCHHYGGQVGARRGAGGGTQVTALVRRSPLMSSPLLSSHPLLSYSPPLILSSPLLSSPFILSSPLLSSSPLISFSPPLLSSSPLLSSPLLFSHCLHTQLQTAPQTRASPLPPTRRLDYRITNVRWRNRRSPSCSVEATWVDSLIEGAIEVPSIKRPLGREGRFRVHMEAPGFRPGPRGR